MSIALLTPPERPKVKRHGPMPLRRVLGAGATVTTICDLLPAFAGAAIVPGQSVAGLKLGDSTAKISALLGKPGTLQQNSGGEQNSLCYGKGQSTGRPLSAKARRRWSGSKPTIRSGRPPKALAWVHHSRP
jgi:hypothetical protein